MTAVIILLSFGILSSGVALSPLNTAPLVKILFGLSGIVCLISGTVLILKQKGNNNKSFNERNLKEVEDVNETRVQKEVENVNETRVQKEVEDVNEIRNQKEVEDVNETRVQKEEIKVIVNKEIINEEQVNLKYNYKERLNALRKCHFNNDNYKCEEENKIEIEEVELPTIMSQEQRILIVKQKSIPELNPYKFYEIQEPIIIKKKSKKIKYRPKSSSEIIQKVKKFSDINVKQQKSENTIIKNPSFKGNLQSIIDLQNRTFKNKEVEQDLENLRRGNKELLNRRVNKDQKTISNLQIKDEPIIKITKSEPKLPILVKKEEKELTEFQKKMLIANQARQNKLICTANVTRNDGKPMKLNQRMATLIESQKKDSEVHKEQREIKKLKSNNFHCKLNTLVDQQIRKSKLLSEDVTEFENGSIKQGNKSKSKHNLYGLEIRRNRRKRNTRPPSYDYLSKLIKE